MLTATMLAIFYIPLFFVLVRRGVRDGAERHPRAAAPARGRRRHEARRRAARAARDRLHDDGAAATSGPTRRSRRPGRSATPISRQAEAALPAVTYQHIFRDPRLQTLIAQALANNRDLMVAAANIAAAREQYRIQRAQQLPTGRRQRRRHRDAATSRASGRAAQIYQRRRSASRASSSTCSAASAR